MHSSEVIILINTEKERLACDVKPPKINDYFTTLLNVRKYQFPGLSADKDLTPLVEQICQDSSFLGLFYLFNCSAQDANASEFVFNYVKFH